MLESSIARVIGPTPPGLGETQPATSQTSAATSPASLPSTRETPTSSTAAPGLTMSPVMMPGTPAAATTMSAPAHVRGEVAGAGVAQRDGGVLGAAGQQQPERAADGDAAADHDDLGAGDLHAVAAQQLDDADGRARQRAGVAEHQPAEVGRVQPVGVLGRVDQAEHAVLVAARGSGSWTM